MSKPFQKNNHNNITQFKQFIQSNYKTVLLITGLTLLNIFFLCWSFASNDHKFGTTFVLILLGSILLEAILCIIILIAKRKSWPIEKLFLILGLIIGIVYVFALPVSRAPDGESHFFRVYEITEGQIISDTSENGYDRGSYQASNIEIVRDFKENNVTYYDVADNLFTQADNNNRTFIKTSASSYNPISYAPHVIGMGIGKVLHLPFLITAYLAKLFNCIACIIILYLCIKFLPFLKEFVFFIAFLPITMQAMTSLSADGFITVIAIALVSFVLYATYSLRSRFTKKHYAIILLLCAILSVSKVVYALLCFLLFTIPKERFGGSKKKIISIFAIGGICIVILASWLLLSASLSGEVDPTNRDILTSNPLLYLSILLKSISTHFYLYLNGTLGGFLEWFNITLSPLYLFPSTIIFAFMCKKVHSNYSVSKSLKILSIFILITVALLTFTTMYTQWTKPGETLIDGVQGRYFLPVLLLIPLAFTGKNKKLPSKISPSKLKQNYPLYIFYIFESVYAITSIICYHI
ncbi:DUF2142 domain-containing protein [Candidatus Saccharibacteria bacterium]|nr:DUF2142 domain-containing protein [Candidatus Saccharibacteria bacterium]